MTARSVAGYPEPLRRVRVRDLETGKAITLLTNNFRLSAWEIAELYRCRWQVELFFKWIKQHLRIKSFYGTSDNAVEDPDLDRDLLVRPRRDPQEAPPLELSLYTMLQILSVSLFEKIELSQRFLAAKSQMQEEVTMQPVAALRLIAGH